MALCISKINYDTACSLLKNKFGIICDSIHKIPDGSANLYRVSSIGSEQYIIKEFQNGFDINRVITEIKITEMLRKHGIPTVEFINTNDNTGYCYNEGNIIVVQRYIEGYTKDYNTLCEKQCMEAADYCRKIVNALENSDISLPVFKMGIFETNGIDESIEKCDSLSRMCNSEDIKRLLNDKKRMLLEAKGIDFSKINKVTFLNSRGDFNLSQFIYDESGNIKAILDFASAKRLPIVWELLRSFIFMDHTYINGEFSTDGFIRYLKRFNCEKILSEYDLEYMFLIYYMYILNSTFGIEQFIRNNDVKYKFIGINLYNQTKFLYQNMQELGETLMKRRREVI